MNKQYYKNPNLYDQTFFFRKPPFWGIFLGLLFFFIFNLFLFLFKFQTTPLGQKYFIITILFFILSFVSLLLAWIAPKILIVGLNKNGVYLKTVGMIFWTEIKSFEIQTIKKQKGYKKAISISFKNPKNFFERSSRWKRFWATFNPTVTIENRIVPIPLEQLQGLLKKYHKQFG